jgi:hypothetical protein
MSVKSGFSDFQEEVDAPMKAVTAAKHRRDVFRGALGAEPDVLKIVPTGSTSRGTHTDPIHDVDLVALYDAEAHPEWGQPGESAEAALEHARGQVKDVLGPESGSDEKVRRTRLNNHSVKCFLDDPDDPDAFTVDVTVGIRRTEGGFWIAERNSASWIASDPLELNRQVAARHKEWNDFARCVRLLKRWNADHGKVMKSLVIEVLALGHLPAVGADDGGRPVALSQFFAAARAAVFTPICDPANLCGVIQSDLDVAAASQLLAEAADLSWRAVDAKGNDEEATSMCLWRELFGEGFPAPDGGCTGTGAGVIAAGTAAVVAGRVTSRPKRPIRDSPQG